MASRIAPAPLVVPDFGFVIRKAADPGTTATRAIHRCCTGLSTQPLSLKNGSLQYSGTFNDASMSTFSTTERPHAPPERVDVPVPVSVNAGFGPGPAHGFP